MLKKIILLLLIIIISSVGWLLFGPCTKFKENQHYLYIRTGQTSKEKILELLIRENTINNIESFEWIGNFIQLWPEISPGKYEIKKGYSLFKIVRMLRNHQQSPVNMVITKIRIPQQMASIIDNKFECDSSGFTNYIQSAECTKRFGIDYQRLLFIVHPNTYTYYWNNNPEAILNKMYIYHQKFWNEERIAKAKQLGLTPLEATTLASIVEEETLREDEKPVIARVYLNRLNKRMPLGADPTVKYATGDFSLRRILLKHINGTAQSPYNTYKHIGLPPGPICTPQDATIDAVLNPDENNYLFFCAAPGYNGRHKFAETDKAHLLNARAYQQWLNEEGIR
jgi:UPF0755 protein